ncbi:MAG: sugar ABC transporter permease [Spirochaetia bacterium]|nr:sugar ABC transporter permease [Spirochaetia bacterium]
MSSKKSSINKDSTGYLFILPFVLIFLIFGLWPLINTFRLSFTDTMLMSRSYKYVGINNFFQIINDPNFIKAFKNTAYIWILNFLPQIGFALLISVWFTSKRLNLKGVGIFRTLFYLPNILMPAAIAALFAALFDYYGPANQILVRLGIFPEGMNFFRDSNFTQAMVIYIQWFMWFGQTIIILMAGMTSISGDFYESAMIDGASSGQMFRKITLPMLRPVLVYTLVTSLVGGMQMFDIPFMLTDGRGAPNGSIMTANVFMYLKYSSNKGHIGLASTVGVIIFVVTSIVALAIFKILKDPDDNPKNKGKRS